MEMYMLRKIFNHLYKSPGKTFLLIGGFFGLLFIFVMPPFQTPDEIVHFMRAYQVSEGGLVSTNRDGVLGGNLPKSVTVTDGILTENPQIKFHPEVKFDYHKTVAALKLPLNKNEREFANIGGATGYSPVGYVPQAIGVAVGSFFNAPVIVLMYMARIAALVTWLVLIFLAVKAIPTKKWAIVGLGILPMVIAQAGSPGIDAMSMGLAVLFMTLVLKYRTLTKISAKQFTLLFIIACLIALTKQTTILVVAFAFLLLPKRVASTKIKGYLKIACLLIVPLALLLAWTAIVKYSNLTIEGAVEGQNNAGQVANLIQHPLRIIGVMFNTFFFQWGDGVVSGVVGLFGWVDTPLSEVFVVTGYILIAFILFANYEQVKYKLSKINKWVISLISVLYAVGTCVALYIVYSPVDFDIIYGLQGRYFLLMLFMLVPLFFAVPIKVEQKHYVITVCSLSVFLLFASVATMIFRYYLS